MKDAEKGLPEGMTFKYTGFEMRKTKTQSAGYEDGDCKLNADVQMIRGKVTFDITQDGKTESESERMTIMQFNGKYFISEL